MMDVRKAAEGMLSLLRAMVEKRCVAERDATGRSVGHAIWMLEGIVRGYIQHEKAHRWLGYAQGILVSHGVIDLQRCKEINDSSEMPE